jgi:hypothetical protein
VAKPQWQQLEDALSRLATRGSTWVRAGEIVNEMMAEEPDGSSNGFNATVNTYCINSPSKKHYSDQYLRHPLCIADDPKQHGKRFRLLTESERQRFLADPHRGLEDLSYEQATRWLATAPGSTPTGDDKVNMPRTSSDYRTPAEEANRLALIALNEALRPNIAGDFSISGRPVKVAEVRRRTGQLAPDGIRGVAAGTAGWPPRIALRAEWDGGSVEVEVRCDRQYGAMTFIVGRGPDVLMQTNVGGRLQGLDGDDPSARVVIDGTASLGVHDDARNLRLKPWSAAAHTVCVASGLVPKRTGGKWYNLGEIGPNGAFCPPPMDFVLKSVQLALIKMRASAADSMSPPWTGAPVWQPDPADMDAILEESVGLPVPESLNVRHGSLQIKVTFEPNQSMKKGERPGIGYRGTVRCWWHQGPPATWIFATDTVIPGEDTRFFLATVDQAQSSLPLSDSVQEQATNAELLSAASRAVSWAIGNAGDRGTLLVERSTHFTADDFHPVDDEDDQDSGVDFTEPYSRADLYADVFVPPNDLDRWIRQWQRKKNLVLQGPPGVGKTFIARRLAYALMGQRDDSRIVQVQFHQSYGYEDFVRGWRPTSIPGAFEQRDGVFLDIVRRAREDKNPHVLILDEINRGNLSRIFGELLTLLEHDKRGPEHALQLAGSSVSDDAFYIPDNLFVLGMMNTADRSLAMVDYALRRRFAFEDVPPAWHGDRLTQHLREHRRLDEGFVARLVAQMAVLNQVIAEDRDLGPGYRVGHSHVAAGGPVEDLAEWWRDVVHGDIGPLLREMWFDRRKVADQHVERLLNLI